MRKIALILLIMPILLMSNVSAFSLSPESNVSSICIGSTIVLATLVNGNGNFLISQEGSASPFTTTVPQSFSTEDSQNVYSYVTASSKIRHGDYDLKVNVNDGTETKQQDYPLTVKDCPKTEFTVESEKHTCPCQGTRFQIDVKNNADYSEDFTFSTEGTLSEWTNLSDSSFTLASGEDKAIEALVTAPCNVNGQYDLNFRLKPKRYFSSLTTNSVLDIQPCYEYSLGAENQVYNLCENGSQTIPLRLDNQGTANNSFSINLDGPKWASVDSKIDVSAGGEKTLNLTLNPPFGTSGNFTMTLNALSSYGNVNKKAEITASVERCYGLSEYFESKEETICDVSKTYSYPLTIKNAGKFDENISLSIDAPEWASLQDDHSIVKSNESKELNVTIKLPSDIEKKGYSITVRAKGSVTESEDTLKIKVASGEECYSPQLTIENDSIIVPSEGSQVVAIDLKNNGLEESTFIISLAGDASSFSMINPGIITVKPGKSEKLYLDIAPQSFTDQKDYKLTVEARVKDSKIASSDSLNITVGGKAQEQSENKTVQGISGIFQGLGSFFSRLKSNAWEILASISNKTTENSIKNSTLKTENATKNAPEPAKISLANTSLNYSAPKFSLSAYFAKLFGSNNQSKNAPSSNESSTLNALNNETREKSAAINNSATENQSKEINQDENQTDNANPDESPEAELNSTVNWDDVKSSLTNFSGYKSYLLGAVSIILLIIIFATGFWKKIIEFFDD